MPAWFAPKEYTEETFADVATYVDPHVGHHVPSLAHMFPR